MARIFVDRREMNEELRRLLRVLENGSDGEGTPAGECSPPFDVLETTAGIEVVIDLPGVAADAVRVLFARNTLVIAGQKRTAGCEHGEAAFHLAERAFGRFARAVKLSGAFDAGHAEASLAAGELRIFLPRIEERRGGEIRIPVRAD